MGRLILAVMATVLLVMPPVSSASMLAFWDFNEGASTVAHDRTGNGNTGTLNGTPSWIAGRFGTAVQFDGSSQWIDFTTSAAINAASSDITVETWVKGLPQGGLALLFDRQHGFTDNTGWLMQFGPDGTTLFFGLGEGASLPCCAGFVGVGAGGVLDGVWHHVAGTYDGSIMRFYVDGTLRDSLSFTGPWFTGTRDMEIARHRGAGPGRYFAGAVDETAVFDQALDAATIESHFSNGITLQQPVPEPSTLLLIGGGLVGLALFRKRGRR